MTERFENAIAQIRKLPDDQQDRVAELLIELANLDEIQSPLTPEQVAGVRLALEQAHRREFASEAAVEGLLRQPWK